MELQYLHEIGRNSAGPETIISDLATRIGLKICDKNFDAITALACTLTWTRDPFDRMITANAGLMNDTLLTKDGTILKNYQNAKW